MERVRTGIAGFDAATGGGLPAGTRTVIYGPPGTGKTVFCLQFLWAGLRAGENVAYNAADRPFPQIRRYFESFGWDPAPYEREGKLVALQTFPHFDEASREPGVDYFVPANLEDLRAASGRLEARQVTRLVAGEYSQALFSVVPAPTLAPIGPWLVDWAFRRNVAVLEVVTATQMDLEGYKGWSLSLKSAQNVIQFRMQGGRREIRILKLEGSSHPLEWVPMEITASGIEMGVV
jgi:KaiC/GvpD/RAD55 family RecA-like ATPase